MTEMIYKFIKTYYDLEKKKKNPKHGLAAQDVQQQQTHLKFIPSKSSLFSSQSKYKQNLSVIFCRNANLHFHHLQICENLSYYDTLNKKKARNEKKAINNSLILLSEQLELLLACLGITPMTCREENKSLILAVQKLVRKKCPTSASTR